jgi:hypothetical protein
LDRALFYALTALLCVRPLISESFERVEFSFLALLTPTGGPTPAATAWLDSLMLAASIAVLARRRGPRRGEAVAAIAIALLGLALVLSVFAAGDKRVAANAGANLLVSVLAGLALIRLMRARWMVHILMAALLATTCANAVKCVTQRAYEFQDTLEYWEEQKPALSTRGFDLDDPALVNFERRLRSAEAYGYLSHPNVTASCLMMGLLAAGGLLGAGLASARRGLGADALPAAAAAGVLGVLLGLGLWLTGSTGAILAAVGGAALLILLGLGHRWVGTHAGRTAVLLAVGYVAVIAAAVVYGLNKGTLPHSSLAFRWHYWTAAARGLPEAPLTGVGRENFGPTFMRYKSPESPEEVRNPHNLWLALLVELGPLGLASGLLLTGAGVVGSLRRLRCTGEQQRPSNKFNTRRLVPVAIGVVLLQAAFSGEQLFIPAVALLWAVILVMTWVVAFMLSAWAVGTSRVGQAHPEWIVAGFAAAILAVLAHNLIGFSLLTPAGIAAFVVCAAVALAHGDEPATVRAPNGARPGELGASRRVGLASALIGALAVLTHLVVITLPTTKAQYALLRMRVLLSGDGGPTRVAAILEAASQALEADRWDAATARAAAAGIAQAAMSPGIADARRLDVLALAREYALIARTRHAAAGSAERLLARIAASTSETHINLARPTEALEALHQAAEHWDAAVALYPTNPRTRISAGKTWFRHWQQSAANASARRVLAHLHEALAINECRNPEDVTRLSPDERESIVQMLSDLQEAGIGSPAASAPAGQSD